MAFTTTRRGGCSAPPYASLNLGHHVGDTPGAVAANRERLLESLSAGQSGVTRIQWLRQLHGTGVVAAPAGEEYPQADACWTRERGVACAVLTADCLPVLFCDRAGTTVAAAHAGWRGLAAGVLEATVAAMGSPAADLLAWLGPAIGPGAFEVGAEVREVFCRGNAAAEQAFLPAHRPGHYFADLYALAQLRLAGIGVGRVYGGDLCTHSDPGSFYSYRRDGETGRMASLIALTG